VITTIIKLKATTARVIGPKMLSFYDMYGNISSCSSKKRLFFVSKTYLPTDWRRRPGRPRYTWLRTLNADLHPLNHGLNSAWRLAQDRERWRQLVETATLQPGARSWWWWWCARRA